MRYSMRNDEFRRRIYMSSYKTNLIDRCVYLHLKKRMDKFVFLSSFHNGLKKFSVTPVRRYCVLTGRSRGVLRHFRLSRLSLNSLMKSRLVNGVRRMTW